MARSVASGVTHSDIGIMKVCQKEESVDCCGRIFHRPDGCMLTELRFYIPLDNKGHFRDDCPSQSLGVVLKRMASCHPTNSVNSIECEQRL